MSTYSNRLLQAARDQLADHVPADRLDTAESVSQREPRRWPEGSEEPREDELTVRYADGEVRFRYRASWGRWEALPPEGDGDNYAWHEINDGSNGDLVEVLDDTPGGAR